MRHNRDGADGRENGAELSSIPFGSLLKAKHKLSRSEALQAAQAAEDAMSLQEPEDEESHRPQRKVQTIGQAAEKQRKRSNGSLMKLDRSSKHA